MRLKTLALGLAVSGSALIAQATNAAVLYSTGFSSPTYSDGALITPPTATDTTTPGQDGWLSCNAAGLTNNILVSNTATNGAVALNNTGQDVRHLLSGVVNSGSIFLSADINVSTAGSGDYFIHLGDGSATIFNARTYIKSSGTGYVMAVGTGSGTAVTYGTTVLPFGTVEHILVRYDLVSGTGNDTGALYINPTSPDGSLDTPYVAATTIGTDATSFDAVYLRQGGGSGVAPTLASVDNIEVDGVAVVPEPASLAILALGALVTVRRRRA